MDLSIAELESLLRQKKTPAQPVTPAAPSSNLKCSFKPTRGSQPECTRDATSIYGNIGYCSEHSRSVQGRRAREAFDKTVAESKPAVVIAVEEPKVPVAPTTPVAVTKTSVLAHPTSVVKKIKRNQWGNYEDTDTHIVFNPRTKAGYGVQDRSGKVVALGPKQIELCEKYGWKYHPVKAVEEESEDEEEEEEEEGDEEESEGKKRMRRGRGRGK